MFSKQDNSKKTVAVAMSGGVDSTVTAALLKQQGYNVRGVFMTLAQSDKTGQTEKVARVAEKLAIPFEVIDLGNLFTERVIEYFVSAYAGGKTPNPCVVCNKMIKFGALVDLVIERGADYLATGHYARVVESGAGVFSLKKGLDTKKDQSYFLCLLSQEKLSRILFPMGGQAKEETYQIARTLGFEHFATSNESQDVCFLENTGVGEYLARFGNRLPQGGQVVTLDGKIIGTNDGIHQFTIGQRRGLGIPDGTPYYVVGLDPEKNEVVVGKKDDLLREHLIIKNINWISGSQPDLPQFYNVKIRYRHEGARAQVSLIEENKILVQFDEPQRAITPGQFAVLYDSDEVIGGGEISR